MSSALPQLQFSTMTTSEQKGDGWWEKMMEMLDRLGNKLEAMDVDQLRLKGRADRVAATVKKA
jgi:prephenate dehydrogenase